MYNIMCVPHKIKVKYYSGIPLFFQCPDYWGLGSKKVKSVLISEIPGYTVIS